MNENFKQESSNEHASKIAELKKKLLDAVMSDEDGAIYAKTLRFGKYLEEKYPDARKHILFHILSGSSGHDDDPLFDFPGDDSVEKFVNEQL